MIYHNSGILNQLIRKELFKNFLEKSVIWNSEKIYTSNPMLK